MTQTDERTYDAFVLELIQNAQTFGVEFKLNTNSVEFIYGRDRDTLYRERFEAGDYWPGFTPDLFYHAETDYNERTIRDIVLKKVREVLTRDEMKVLDGYYANGSTLTNTWR